MYFDVSLCTGTYTFNCKCESISEAYDAVSEASEVFGIEVDLREIIVALAGMKEGTMQLIRKKYYHGFLEIIREEGEV